MEDTVKVLISQEELEARMDALAARINEEYAGRELRVVCILKGSVFFTCGLAKRLTVPVTMDFMQVSSYGKGTVSSGQIRMVKDLDESIEGMHVLVIEDIVDTGHTLHRLLQELSARKPASLRVCTLLDKPERREVEVAVDYVGFRVPDRFIVGYGLDCGQKYRNLPYIGYLE